MAMIHYFNKFLLLLLFQGVVSGGLKADKEALLDFATVVVPHSGHRRLQLMGWSHKKAAQICSSWLGVTCNPDRSRVAGLRLPRMGLAGAIPENTIRRLDALQTLNLQNNRLSGSIPPSLKRFPASSFRGKLFLCGPPLSHQCPPLHQHYIYAQPPSPSRSLLAHRLLLSQIPNSGPQTSPEAIKKPNKNVILIAVLGVVLACIAFFIMWRCHRKWKREKRERIKPVSEAPAPTN
ncbi:unnamed protein product [Cuscuta epithymum]|uniref:Leucine-rich repeat-containing N-terminal plant-type domain-containing protein n=1 Tax=Cuscuta epithymum TaxID=186058 RepID=A0AAV0GIP1_9ASTE|nr:unnamed protein product [Cuscuta epithymum]CAH9147785.1 unnamed protein product [Cuscuta epithymum]